MQRDTRPRITELNPHLLCVLCGGYYIDATAIVECLHSFCKSCIVRYLETRKYCPICDVLVHKTKPLQSLRPDTQIQSIVYKLIPNLYEKEMRNRRNYYVDVHPSLHPQNAEQRGEISETSNFFSISNTIDFTLEYMNQEKNQEYYYVAPDSRRYFRCQASVTIEHVKKLIEAKYTPKMNHEIRFFCNKIQLPEHLTFLDIAYMSAWKRRGFINILYDIKLAVQNTSLKTEPSPALAVTVAPCSDISLAQTTAIVTSNTPPPTPPLCVEIASVKDNTSVSKVITEPPEDVIVANVCIEKQTSVLAAVVVTSASEIDPNNPIDDQERRTVVLCNVSTSTSPSVPSFTVTCSMNSDSVTVSSVGTPITTSSCELPMNGVSSPQENRIDDSKYDEPQITEQKIVVSHKQTEKAILTAETTKDESKKLSDSPTMLKYPINLEGAKSVAVAKTICNDTSPSPAKIPKLSELAERVQSFVDHPVAKKSALDLPTCITTAAAVSSISPVTNSTSNITTLGSLKTSAAIAPVPRLDGLSKNSPRSIFTRPDVPIITKSTTKIMKSFTRPWNSTSSNPLHGVNDKSRSMKMVKAARSTPPRYLTNPVTNNRSSYEVTTVTMSGNKAMTSSVVEESKKSAKIFPVMKIDPQTLSPISAPSATLSNVYSPLSSESLPTKKSSSTPYPSYIPVSTEHYTSTTSGPFTSNNLSTSSVKPLGSYMMPSSLLPINQLMYEMYGNGGTKTLEYMKAMTTNFCPPPMFHPSLSAVYTSLPRSTNSKYEKSLSRIGVKVSDKLPPTEQRIPPSNNNNHNNNNNNTKLAVTEHSSGEKRYTPSYSKHDDVSNGQLKNKSTRKISETSSFSINNLIPSEMGKLPMPSHSCSADGVHQMCDQREPQQNHEQSNDKPKETTLTEKKIAVESEMSSVSEK